jgi:hypothetical protein
VDDEIDAAGEHVAVSSVGGELGITHVTGDEAQALDCNGDAGVRLETGYCCERVSNVVVEWPATPANEREHPLDLVAPEQLHEQVRPEGAGRSGDQDISGHQCSSRIAHQLDPNP